MYFTPREVSITQSAGFSKYIWFPHYIVILLTVMMLKAPG